MPLVAATISSVLKSKLLANHDSAAVDNPALEALCKAVAETIVEQITSTALVTTVTTCPAGTGSGTGTIA